MTQDQYGQAQDSGPVRGQVVEDDETEEFSDGQDKKMTTFQKVASALRGDRLDRDEPDQGQVPADQMGTAAPTATGPDVAVPGQTTQAGTRPDTTPRDEAEATDAGEALDAQDATATAQGPNGTYPNGTITTTGSGAQRDYWDAPGTSGTGESNVAAVTSPDVPVTDTDADPLARQDTAVGQDTTVGYDTTLGEGTAAGQDAAMGQNAGMGQGDRVGRDTSGVQQPTATQPDVYGTEAAATGTGTSAADSGYQDQAVTATNPADSGYQDEAATATIPDVPVTQTPGDATEADAAEADATGGAGRRAAQGQELHPGEATGSLDDLGDLAYGNLIPDAADFTEQWQQIQFKFVDDPHASVTEAAEVVAQVTARMEAAIQERQRAIEARQRAIADQQQSLRGRWGEGAEADTETLRETLRMYRAFLDQLIGPKA
jgi:hypothetical protein